MPLNRRAFLNACSAAGIASPLLPGILYTLAVQAQETVPPTPASAPATNAATSASAVPARDLPKITVEMLDHAAALAGVGPFTADQTKMMLDGLNEQRNGYDKIRALNIPNSVPPAYVFHPAPAAQPGEAHVASFTARTELSYSGPDAPVPKLPANLDDLAFASILDLASLLWNHKITSLQLTQMYLARLKRYDPKLHFVITLTEERALDQAKAADEEMAAGLFRGPLHGIPWGVKDLLSVKGYPTTWGAGGFEHQTINEDATVVKRLDGKLPELILVAKFSLGALAMGDKWFGGRTRNPWNPEQGSSGSSAGSASAVAAGCVAFAIGSETLGSISSPSTRCGDTGLRPTFGTVRRAPAPWR